MGADPWEDGTGRGLDAAWLAAALRRYVRLLGEHEQHLNDLNVFPVPDGDTGTNLRLTAGATLAALDRLGSAAGDLDVLVRSLPRAAQLAARGTSGVILSEALRGLLETLGTAAQEGGSLGAALEAAARAAYAAVAEPVEGTMLSVAAAVGAAGTRFDAGDPDLDTGAPDLDTGEPDRTVAVLDAAADAAWDAVADTPRQLPLLARAGVVDAGGVGYALLIEALALAAGAERPGAVDPDDWFVGSSTPSHPPRTDRAGGSAPGQAAPVDARLPSPAGAPATADPDGDAYEVIVTLAADPGAIEHLQQAWAALGSALVVAGDGGLYRAHVHTSPVDRVVAAARAAGEVLAVEIADLALQGEEAAWVRAAAPTVARRRSSERTPPRRAVLVAVFGTLGPAVLAATGGIDRVVATEADRSPSTEEVVSAIEGAPGEVVIVLPDGKDTAAVARLAASLAVGRDVEVVEAGGVLEVLEVVRDLDRAAAPSQVLAELAARADTVHGARIQAVVRDAVTEQGPVARGQWLARGAGRVLAVGDDLAAVTLAAVEGLLDASSGEVERVTVLWGAGLDEEAFVRVTDQLLTRWPELDQEVLDADPDGAEVRVVLVEARPSEGRD